MAYGVTVFNYSINENEILTFDTNDIIAEDICILLCKKLNISQGLYLMFALRIQPCQNSRKSKLKQKELPQFVPSCHNILFDNNTKYEFRLRFQLPDVTTINKRDKNAYDYFFKQMRHDLFYNNIPELIYPNHINKVLGLTFTSMLIDVLEGTVTIDELIRNRKYVKYVPKKIRKKFTLFLGKRIKDEFDSINIGIDDIDYVKCNYVQSLTMLAPHYLMEQYEGSISSSAEDKFDKAKIPINIQINPYDQAQPGLTITYCYNKNVQHISDIADIYAISICDENVVTIETRTQTDHIYIYMKDKVSMESFVSCLAGYYRLMANWTCDVCSSLKTKSLDFLLKNKCHGPIGYSFSYTKLLKFKTLGGYIVRQCEYNYDTFYVDILTKEGFNVQPETFKLIYTNNRWQRKPSIQSLSSDESQHSNQNNGTNLTHAIYEDLNQMVYGITKSSGVQLPPSPYEKPPLLLICAKPDELTSKQLISEDYETELRKENFKFLQKKSFHQFINTKVPIENGRLVQMRGDWIVESNKKLEVTLKSLQSDADLSEFLSLANTWSTLSSSELTKLYGITLASPYTMVFESNRLGSLQTFLQKGTPKVTSIGLIDAGFQLARALVYLHDKKIIHKRIRCSNINVVRFEPPNDLMIRLCDPGFDRPYDKTDIPWIPFEYFKNMEMAKCDPKAEVWAMSTTLWEMFSQGALPPLQICGSGKCLPKPTDCTGDIYSTIRKGWDKLEKRLLPQGMLIELLTLRESHVRPYYRVESIPASDMEMEVKYRQISETISNSTSNMETDIDAIITTHLDNLSIDSGESCLSSMPFIQTFNNIEEIIDELSAYDMPDGGNIIFQGEIGEGHYGTVFKGTYEKNCNEAVLIAIKVLKLSHLNSSIDFTREIEIMKKLDHPNIVRIVESIENPMAIIMEYVKNDTLTKYVAGNTSLKITQYLQIARDIACGMEYLCTQNIVHRDLAARNILIGEFQMVKISDFGLAQKANENGYYLVVTQSRELPIKWYAPEILESNKKYSHKSDVWSYGITLIEMFSGNQPNLVTGVELGQLELLQRLQSNERLTRPDRCHTEIYKRLIIPCWHYNPKMRPTFEDIHLEAKSLLENVHTL